MPDQTPENPGGHQAAPVDRIDPNVTMPPHVLAAQKASQAAFAAAYEAPAAPANGQAAQAPAAPAAPTNGAQPAAPEQHELPELNADGSVNWENRFKALKGRYDADSRRWGETQAAYEQRMRELDTTLQKVTRKPLPGEEPPPVLLTPKEIEDYGADLIDVIKRAAQEAVVPLLKPIAETVGQVQARVETAETETSKQFLTRMHSSMDSAVPGWQELNKDPNFIAWTKRPDVYSGLNRQELLQRAWYAGDSNRVAAFFQGYLAEEAATDPAAAAARQQAGIGQAGHAAQPPAPGNQAPPSPRVTLEQLAAPGRARAAAPAPAGKPVWTAEGIAAFYQDVARGVFRGRDAERIATEADLMAAQREGRIQINPRTATNIGG